MWFLHDGTGYTLCYFAHREQLAWLFYEPHTGLEDCLNMLLSCFRKMNSAAMSESIDEWSLSVPCHVGLVVLRAVTAAVVVVPEEAVVLPDDVDVRPVAGRVALQWSGLSEYFWQYIFHAYNTECPIFLWTGWVDFDLGVSPVYPAAQPFCHIPISPGRTESTTLKIQVNPTQIILLKFSLILGETFPLRFWFWRAVLCCAEKQCASSCRHGSNLSHSFSAQQSTSPFYK